MKSLIVQPVPVLSGIVCTTNPRAEFNYGVVAYEQITGNYREGRLYRNCHCLQLGSARVIKFNFETLSHKES